MANSNPIVGEIGAESVDYAHQRSNAELNAACEANVGNMVVITMLMGGGEAINVIGQLVKTDGGFCIKRSKRDAHLTDFELSHTDQEEITEQLPTTGCCKIVRFTVWAQSTIANILKSLSELRAEKDSLAIRLEGCQKQLAAVCNEEAAPSFAGPTDEAFIGWELRQFLGRGSFGAAYKATLRDGRTVCVKVVELVSLDPKCVERFRTEMEVMQRLNHPNIVQYYGLMEDKEKDTLNIFMEYVDGGSLASFAKEQNANAPLSEGTLRDWSRQMLCGVKYLHDSGVIHQNIKGDNVLVRKRDGVLKLADFGCCNVIYDVGAKTYANGIKELLYWTVPEVVTCEGYSQKSDIWSVGCTIIEMITGKPVWPIERRKAIFRIEYSEPPLFFAEKHEYLSPAFVGLLKRMFEIAQSQRPSAAELLDDPLFAVSPVGVQVVQSKEKGEACDFSDTS